MWEPGAISHPVSQLLFILHIVGLGAGFGVKMVQMDHGPCILNLRLAGRSPYPSTQHKSW